MDLGWNIQRLPWPLRVPLGTLLSKDPPFASPLPQCLCLPGVRSGVLPVPTASATSPPLHFLPQKLLEPDETPVPQELTTATSAQTVPCQMDFLGQPECRESRPSWGEGRCTFLLTSISQSRIFPRTNLQPRFPWLPLPYKNNFISKEQITPSAHNRCQELFLF